MTNKANKTNKKVSKLKEKLLQTDGGRSVIIAYFYVMGVLFHALPFTFPLMKYVTPFFLAAAGGIVFYFTGRGQTTRFFLWCIGTYVVTFAVEVIGVKTGVVFGAYWYGTVLGPKLLETPVVIGFNWLLVIIGFASLAGRLVKNRILAAAITGAGAALFDFILEPVAIRLSYWTWEIGKVPLQNYIAWFVIAFAAAFVFFSLRLEVKSKLPAYYVAIQGGFFIILRFIV